MSMDKLIQDIADAVATVGFLSDANKTMGLLLQCLNDVPLERHRDTVKRMLADVKDPKLANAVQELCKSVNMTKEDVVALYERRLALTNLCIAVKFELDQFAPLAEAAELAKKPVV